jgi:hypothetical protein
MHDCKYKNACLFDRIEHTVWKPVYKAAMNILFYHRPSMGMSNDGLYCSKDLDREIITQPRFTILIIGNCRPNSSSAPG